MEEQHGPDIEANQRSSGSQENIASSPLASAFLRQHPEWVSEIVNALGETTYVIPREQIVAACVFLKSTPELQFNFLADLCDFDRGPSEEPRCSVNYHLFSATSHHWLPLK